MSNELKGRTSWRALGVLFGAAASGVATPAFALDEAAETAPDPFPAEEPGDEEVERIAGQRAHGTTVSARNLFFVELGGSGTIWSANYEHRLADRFAVRAGAGYFPARSYIGGYDLFTVPVTASWLPRTNRGHGAELGLGIVGSVIWGRTGLFDGLSSVGAAGNAIVGYRYQRDDGGFVFRAAVTPLFSATGLLPWGGVSFGHAF